MGLTVKKSFKGIDISDIRKMNALAKDDTLNLGIGQLVEDLAPSVKKAGIDAFSEGHTRYTSNQGLLELREAVASYESNKCNKVVNANQVIITNGGEGALWNILYTYLDKGDSILIPEIAFSVYETISKLQVASATGLRLGWTIAEEQITKPMVVANQYISTCASSISQHAALSCFDGSSDRFLNDVRTDLAKKGHYAYEFLKKIHGMSLVKPNGAFYIFPNISKWGDSKTVALKILHECNVLTIPGLAFGKRGDEHIRISFAVDFDVLKEALEKIKNLLNEWDTYES